MDRNYNRHLFDSRDEEQVNQFIEFLKFLMLDNKKFYNDIHIYQDDFFYIVEWVQNNWDDKYGSNSYWKLLESEDTIYTEIYLPDNTYQWIPKGTEDEFMKEWLEENPGWVKTEYGTWFNQEVQDKLMKDVYTDLGENVGIK